MCRSLINETAEALLLEYWRVFGRSDPIDIVRFARFYGFSVDETGDLGSSEIVRYTIVGKDKRISVNMDMPFSWCRVGICRVVCRELLRKARDDGRQRSGIVTNKDSGRTTEYKLALCILMPANITEKDFRELRDQGLPRNICANRLAVRYKLPADCVSRRLKIL